MPGFKRGPDGHVSTARTAEELGVDRRVLKQLHEGGDIAGMRAGGVLWLEAASLAAYVASRPSCIADGCDQLVIGDGPGCHLHRRSGRHNSEETKRKRVQTRRRTMADTGRAPLLRVVQWHLCEREGCGNWTDQERFCSHDCSRAVVLNRDLARLREGHGVYRDNVQRVKAERKLLDVEQLVKRLRQAGVPRTAAAISDHIRNGWLRPERGLGFDKPQLFTGAAVDEYVDQLRSEDRDKRLLRYDEQPFRGDWHQARHGSTAGYGLLNADFGRLGGAKPEELGALTEGEIRRLRAEGYSLRRIEIALHGDATFWQIRRVLGA